MDKISSTSSLIEGIVEVYDDLSFQRQLKKTKDEISDIFIQLLDSNCKKYDLISNNSVRDIKYYDVSGRIKEKDSFHEKMIRGNLCYSFLDKEKYTAKKEIIENFKNIRKQIKQIADDILGIKITTEVDEDCKKVLKLLKDNQLEFLNDKNQIYLDLAELEEQPKKMRNGLEIYKIKGIYKTTNQFELQIKSKLLSVWGDMDHAMFYKDYSVSPIKKSVQDSMVHLGTLLKEIDKFLLQIRESTKSFAKNKEVIDFIESFSLQYTGTLSKKLRVGVRLDEITEFLFFLYKHPKKIKNTSDRVLDFSYLGLKSTHPEIKKYVELRNKNFNLQIIEIIYFVWFCRIYTERDQKLKSFTTNIPKLLDKYLEYKTNNLPDGIKFYSDYLNKNYFIILVNLNSGEFFINTEMLYDFLNSLKNIEIYAEFEDEDEDNFSKDQIDITRNFLLLVYFKQNAKNYLTLNNANIDISLLISKIDKINFSFDNKSLKEIQQLMSAKQLVNKSLEILKDL